LEQVEVLSRATCCDLASATGCHPICHWRGPLVIWNDIYHRCRLTLLIGHATGYGAKVNPL
jgi:hypothetical protein